MYLKDIDWKNIGALLVIIRNQGGWEFLKSLKIRRLTNKRGKIKCSCCKKVVGEKTYILTITEKPVFDDSFHSPKCAEISLRWLLGLYFHFKEYMEPENSNKIPEDEIRDPLPIQEGEALRAYRKRYESHLAQQESSGN